MDSLTDKFASVKRNVEHRINELKLPQLDQAEEKLKVPKLYIVVRPS